MENTEKNARVLRSVAAQAGRVSVRTINRWSALGLISVKYAHYRGQLVPHYDLAEVRAVAIQKGHIAPDVS